MSDVGSRKGKRSVACRECQRLKLKCNRSWPCESCIKRGVEDICPEGVLPTTKRQRLNLIDTSRLYETNVQMSDRIRKLESALGTLQGSVTRDPHPLLRDDLLALGAPLELPPIIEGIKPIISSNSSIVEDTIEAFGTLAIGNNGHTIFHSHAVGADYLIEPPWAESMTQRSIAEALALNSDILELSSLFPFGDNPMSRSFTRVKHQILCCLPPMDKIVRILKAYYEFFSWWHDPVPHDYLERDVLPIITSPPEAVRPDKLSFFFMVLSIGTVVDITSALDLQAGDAFYQLARASFCLEPVFDVSSSYTAATLQLMSAYLHLSNRQKLEYHWMLMGLTARIVHSAGLHYDGANWLKNVEEDPLVELRRKIFNEALAYDVMISFTMGRPPGYSLAHVQCKLPLDDEKFITAEGVEECGFSNWRYRFSKECLIPVMDDVFGARSPSYNTILRLDRRLKEFPVPSHLRYPGIGGQPEELNLDQISMRLWMQRAYLFGLREISLLCLHRSHFAQALLERPENPFEGKFAASVLAVYRSASRIVAGVRDISYRYLTLVSRSWWVWQNLFAAGTALSMLVLRAPSCNLAGTALAELDLARDLIQNRSLSCRSQHARRVMEKLTDSAKLAFKTGKPITTASGLAMFDQDERMLFTTTSRTVIHDPRNIMTETVPEPEAKGDTDIGQEWRPCRPDLVHVYDDVGILGPLTPPDMSNRGTSTSNGHSFSIPEMLSFQEGREIHGGAVERHWEEFLRQFAP